MKDQGKRDSQIQDSKDIIFIALMIISVIMAVLVGLNSCTTSSQSLPYEEEEKVWIHIDRDSFELVADEYGNQYIKQYTKWPHPIYIPYTGATEELDTLRFYNVKNQ